MATTYTYKDFDLNFGVNEFGDIDTLEDEDSIKQSIKNIVLTTIGESAKYQNPKFGGDVFKSLGEKINRITAIDIGSKIESALLNWEHRISIIDIIADPDIVKNAYVVTIKYKIKNLNITNEITINLGIIK